MTPAELNNIGILQWDLLRPRYARPDLLLGNGFSIALSPNFRYPSLFSTFISKTQEPFTALFSQFGTTNFELILNYLTSASKVNTILGLPVDQINAAIEILKNGLIESIREIHPRVDQIDWGSIDHLTQKFEEFGNIFSTNYDLYLYHIIMKSIDISRVNNSYVAYQDYFWGYSNPGFKEFMGYQNYHYKHVYYLHGALCIFNDGIKDVKITRSNANDELIEIVSQQIQAGRFPLFVTEGTGADKLSAIYRSNYLYFCLNKLREHKNTPIIVYGNSLSEFDSHIVDALVTSRRELIIAIYTNGRTDVELQNERYGILAKFPTNGPSIYFIDSVSLFA
jgi:hypothetical protein